MTSNLSVPQRVNPRWDQHHLRQTLNWTSWELPSPPWPVRMATGKPHRDQHLYTTTASWLGGVTCTSLTWLITQSVGFSVRTPGLQSQPCHLSAVGSQATHSPTGPAAPLAKHWAALQSPAGDSKVPPAWSTFGLPLQAFCFLYSLKWE